MNRHDFLKTLSTGTAVLAVPGCMDAAKNRGVEPSAERPNIPFCISDDQLWLHTLINGDKAEGIRETIMPTTSRTS